MEPVEPPAVETLAPELIRAEVERVSAALDACRAGRPPPPATSISFEVRLDGTVLPDVRLSDPELDVCAARALSAMRFPPLTSTVVVSYPPALGDPGPPASTRVPTSDGGWIDVVAVGPGADGVRTTRLLRFAPDGARRTGPVPPELWLDWGADGTRLASAVTPIRGTDAVRIDLCTRPGRLPCETVTLDTLVAP